MAILLKYYDKDNNEVPDGFGMVLAECYNTRGPGFQLVRDDFKSYVPPYNSEEGRWFDIGKTIDMYLKNPIFDPDDGPPLRPSKKKINSL